MSDLRTTRRSFAGGGGIRVSGPPTQNALKTKQLKKQAEKKKNIREDKDRKCRNQRGQGEDNEAKIKPKAQLDLAGGPGRNHSTTPNAKRAKLFITNSQEKEILLSTRTEGIGPRNRALQYRRQS